MKPGTCSPDEEMEEGGEVELLDIRELQKARAR
jgi:hypothetical protein